MKILMAGCGKMGGAMLSRWTGGEMPAITVVDPADVDTPNRIRHVRSIEALKGEKYDALIVAVKPQMMEDVLPPYARLLRPGAFALSIAAGVPAERVSRLLGKVPVARVMPNLPAACGQGMSALFAQDGVTATQKVLVGKLVSATGEIAWIEDEARIDMFTALAGSGPGYVFEIMRALQQIAEERGFTPIEARQIAVETVAGAGELARRDARSLEQLRDDVTSPGGTTDAGLTVLRRDRGVRGLLEDTVDAAFDRAVELR
ncbi:pyrroline-5-carboxylate reductase family protein [Sphingomicrobium astaxanthinifaciens]|uniref:pyrroline-5-carboxylate reductase family protein n=1 Tax=Sphingomicrobium astaxanthinifaciens TaxID=1227949 RepID=UPI001FCBFC56|nr:pyrroline-5-carboxylate reductase [Sphingomicrobium astaxanthinifaciens]MCJ7420248.1 pyrroline-5-carboxylate reductase [Sphingomicrobium astaxanthinifaciens]